MELATSLSWDSFLELVVSEITRELSANPNTLNPGVEVSRRLCGVAFHVSGSAAHIRPERFHLGVELVPSRIKVSSNVVAIVDGVSCHFIPDARALLETVNDGDIVECEGIVGESSFWTPPINWFPTGLRGEARLGIAMSNAQLRLNAEVRH